MKKTLFVLAFIAAFVACKKTYILDANTQTGNGGTGGGGTGGGNGLGMVSTTPNAVLLKYVTTNFNAGNPTDSILNIVQNDYVGTQKRVVIKQVKFSNPMDTTRTLYTYNTQNKLIKIETLNSPSGNKTELSYTNGQLTQIVNYQANIYNDKFLFTHTPNGTNNNVLVNYKSAAAPDTTDYVSSTEYKVKYIKFILTINPTNSVINNKLFRVNNDIDNGDDLISNDTINLASNITNGNNLTSAIGTTTTVQSVYVNGLLAFQTDIKQQLTYTFIRDNNPAQIINDVANYLYGVNELPIVTNIGQGTSPSLSADVFVNQYYIGSGTFTKSPCTSAKFEYNSFTQDGVSQPFPFGGAPYYFLTNTTVYDASNRLSLITSYTPATSPASTAKIYSLRFIY